VRKTLCILIVLSVAFTTLTSCGGDDGMSRIIENTKQTSSWRQSYKFKPKREKITRQTKLMKTDNLDFTNLLDTEVYPDISVEGIFSTREINRRIQFSWDKDDFNSKSLDLTMFLGQIRDVVFYVKNVSDSTVVLEFNNTLPNCLLYPEDVYVASETESIENKLYIKSALHELNPGETVEVQAEIHCLANQTDKLLINNVVDFALEEVETKKVFNSKGCLAFLNLRINISTDDIVWKTQYDTRTNSSEIEIVNGVLLLKHYMTRESPFRMIYNVTAINPITGEVLWDWIQPDPDSKHKRPDLGKLVVDSEKLLIKLYGVHYEYDEQTDTYEKNFLDRLFWAVDLHTGECLPDDEQSVIEQMYQTEYRKDGVRYEFVGYDESNLIDKKTGKALWSYDGTRISSFVVQDEMVLIHEFESYFSADSRLVLYSLAGEKLMDWDFDEEGKFFKIGNNVIFVEGDVIFGEYGGCWINSTFDTVIYGVDIETMDFLWKYTNTKDDGKSQITASNNYLSYGDIFFVNCGSEFVGIDSDNGNELWSIDFASQYGQKPIDTKIEGMLLIVEFRDPDEFCFLQVVAINPENGKVVSRKSLFFGNYFTVRTTYNDDWWHNQREEPVWSDNGEFYYYNEFWFDKNDSLLGVNFANMQNRIVYIEAAYGDCVYYFDCEIEEDGWGKKDFLVCKKAIDR